MERTPFTEFLEREFTRIQYERKKRLTIAEFAKILGFSPGAISLWMNGERRPDETSIRKMAKILSPEIYDFFGMPRPDPDLESIANLWSSISEEKRRLLREQAEKYVTENEAAHPFKRRPSEKTH